MKRRFKSAIKYPPKTLNSSAAGVTDDRFDVIKAKKVTFPDSAADPLPNVERVALSKKYQTARDPSSDMPKTSEYAFFKKVKKDIGHCKSNLLQEGSKLSECTKSNNCITGATSTYNVLKRPNKDLKIPIQVEKAYQTNEYQSFSPVESVIGISKEAKSLPAAVTPVDSNLWLSPLPSNNSGTSKEARHKSFYLPAAVTPLDSKLRLSPLEGPSNNSGSQYAGSGIFAAKRQKLRQRANSLFLDVEKLNSDRFDLVSALLRRLFPGRKEDEDSQVKKGESESSLAYAKPDRAKSLPHSRHIEDVTQPEYWMSPTDGCPENFFGRPKERVPQEWDNFTSVFHLIDYDADSNLHYKDHAKTRPLSRHREDVTVPKYRMSQTDGCRSYFFDRLKGRVPLEWDNFTSAFHLIDYDVETGLHYEDADNNQISNNKLTKSLWDQSDSLPSSFSDRRVLADDILHSENIPVSREALNLSLYWDFNKEKTNPALAIATFGENKLCSPIATSRHIDYQWSTEKKLDELALWSSSLFTNSAYFDALPYFRSTSFPHKLFRTNLCSKDFGTILEHEEYAAARLDQFDLPLICNSEDLTSLEDCNPVNAFESGNVIVPYLSHPAKNHVDSDTLLPMVSDTFSWKFLSATNSPLQQDLSTYHALTLPCIEDKITLPQEEVENGLYSLNPIETALPSFELALNSYIWSSCNPEVSCQEASDGSLLLDNTSWVTPVEEVSPDPSDEWTWS